MRFDILVALDTPAEILASHCLDLSPGPLWEGITFKCVVELK